MPDEIRRILRRYGSVPVERRTLRTTPESLADMEPLAGGNLGAAALVWDRRGRILLIRHAPGSAWGDLWVTPGGAALPGEGPEDTLLREVREEAGALVRILNLTKVYELTLTDGDREVTGFFFQFEAEVLGDEARPGPGIREVRWFEELPESMAFREDYLEPFLRRRPRP